MQPETLFKTDLWRRFDARARRNRRDPLDLLTDVITDYLNVAELDELDREIGRDLRRNGVHPNNAVQVVREYREERKRRRAAS